MVAIGETPDSSAWAFMAGGWILTFRCAPARRPAWPNAGGDEGRTREGARFTYGVHLQEPLQVSDAVDLTVREPLQHLARDLGAL